MRVQRPSNNVPQVGRQGVSNVMLVALSGCLLALQLSTTQVPAVEPAKQSGFIPFDTSHLMGLPDSHPVFGVENPFPQLSFVRPVDLTNANDGSNRIFVVEQDGRVRVSPNSEQSNEASVFLDITKQVRREDNEEGLLGLAFHPKYRENGQFFVFYSVTPRGSVVSRFRVSKDDVNRADPSSEERLLDFSKPYGNHNGGCLKFGPDGFLYISVGDGGLANDPHENAQNLEVVQGKILRIDVDHQDAGKNYAIPKDNPFADSKANARGEIWAYGFRNPWRMSFDRQTGTLWEGDVGQDHHEEINIVTRRGNYGWNIREGKHPRDPDAIRDRPQSLIDPIFDYPRVEGKCITGGLVYRGKRLPQLEGLYLYADFYSGNIWALKSNGKQATATHKIAHTSLMISAFGEDEAGEIYFTAFDGKIYRLKTPEPGEKQDFPRTLTETKLFSSVKDQTPAPGLIPYAVNVQLWSDGAVKDRFIALPSSHSLVFKEQEQWEFPAGTVIVKTFSLQTDKTDPEKRQRIETRLWLNSPRGWEGYTYLWNPEQTEATLLGDWPFRKDYPIQTAEGIVKQEWYFPSRSDCQACHSHNIGFVLGWNTRNLNRLGGHENQIDRFKSLDLFKNPPDGPTNKLEAYPRWEDEKS
ncbi:MAG: yliI, partial [Planctomycetaceae bacterium]|nr:yliI [Planctomycetaceae bacterium]